VSYVPQVPNHRSIAAAIPVLASQRFVDPTRLHRTPLACEPHIPLSFQDRPDRRRDGRVLARTMGLLTFYWRT
jgi:hypothetical protein